MQETFARAMRAGRAPTEADELRRWLYRIATNATIDRLRRERLLRFVPFIGTEEAPRAESDETELVRRALRSISPEQATALVLRLHEGFTPGEIASMIGIGEAGGEVPPRSRPPRVHRGLRTDVGPPLMPHADQLILAGRDAEHDPATELLLHEHLRECAECRELRRKAERVDRLIAAPEPTIAAPSLPPAVAVHPRLGRAAIASIAVVVVVVGVVAGSALRTLRDRDEISPVGAPGGPPSPTLPKDRQLVIEQDLLIPLPPGWRKDVDTLANPPGSDAPRILSFVDPGADAAAARTLSIWIWPSWSLDVVRDHYVVGNLSFISQGSFPSWRPVQEVLGSAGWSAGPAGAGSYRARHLFVQADPERVVDVSVLGPRVPGDYASEPTADMRSIQETVIGHIVALGDTAAVFTADRARAAIERRLPVESIQVPDPSPFLKPVMLRIQGRADSAVRIDAYPAGTRPRSTLDPSLVHGDSPPGSPSTIRVIGNLVVWVRSPDANVRYTVLTALDALLDPSSATGRSISFEIKPVPPSQTTGTGRATLTPGGDLVLEVSVHGSEVMRTDPSPRPNFIWHLLEGTCAAWQRNEPGNKVIARWELPAQQLDAQEFRYVVTKSELDDMTRPHAVAAFRSGGSGPLYACGDVAPFTATGPVPLASSSAPPSPGFRNGTCTTGPLSESTRSGEYTFGPDILDEENEFIVVQKRGARIGERLSAILRRLDGQGLVGLPPFPAEPFGSGELVFRAGVYKPAGKGCWQVDLMDPTDGRVVASYVVRVQDAENGCPRTRTTDHSGVITTTGLVGITGTTVGRASDIDGSFGWMVRRGATTVGQRVAVVFRQIGSSAPASSVSFDIPAVPHQTAWGDLAFSMGYKPIGFANSCWRLIVDGADSGIVLFVGP